MTVNSQVERWKLVIEVWDVCNLWFTKPDGTTDDLEKAIESVFYQEVKEEPKK